MMTWYSCSTIILSIYDFSC